MHRDDYEYDLPSHLIAQHPAQRRDASRLLVVRRGGGVLAHQHFHDLPQWLQEGDLLVLNDTQVLPARLLGHREQTGGKWEGLFVHEQADGSWELLAQTRGRPVEGEVLLVEGSSSTEPALRVQLIGRSERGRWLVRPLDQDESTTTVSLLEKYGHIPLPPYIRKGRADEEDRTRYQTIYAAQPGAVAAPTAGLHFTDETFAQLDAMGVRRAFVTLHVGIGTFQPIAVENIEDHPMHPEWGNLPAATVEAIRACKVRGGRVVSVGTTSVRVLESAARGDELRPWSGMTDLFIRPPFDFRVVDALITNFHLPRSTLLLLVAAFAGRDNMMQAYRKAIERAYRFYSYGDAMFITPGNDT